MCIDCIPYMWKINSQSVVESDCAFDRSGHPVDKSFRLCGLTRLLGCDVDLSNLTTTILYAHSNITIHSDR